MYEELIRRLREEPLDSNKAALPIMDLCIDAATAIENLSHRLDMAQGERDAVTRHMIELEKDVCRLKSRLADYEDSGLEPEEIADFMKRWEQTVEIGGMLKKYGINHIWDIIQAEQDGRLVVLPCKVGDRLYEVTGRKTISVYEVRAIRVELFGLFIEWDIVEGFAWQSLAGINAGEIGKTVFLTREEAEKALEAMKK